MTIQKIILYISIILLLLFTFFIYNVVSKASRNSIYPPRVPRCPDYFKNGLDSTNNFHECYNTYKLGNYKTGKGKNTEYCKYLPKSLITDDSRTNIRGKCQYVKDCKVGWDGLTSDICS